VARGRRIESTEKCESIRALSRHPIFTLASTWSWPALKRALGYGIEQYPKASFTLEKNTRSPFRLPIQAGSRPRIARLESRRGHNRRKIARNPQKHEGLQSIAALRVNLVAGEGFEPSTFGL